MNDTSDVHDFPVENPGKSSNLFAPFGARKDVKDILKEYPFCITYKNVDKNSKSWIQQSNVKVSNFLLCKDINVIIICILQAYISFLSIESDFTGVNTVDEYINMYNKLPDMDEKKRKYLTRQLLSLKKDYKESIKRHKEKNELFFSTKISFDLHNNNVLTFDISTTGYKYFYFDYENLQKKCNFKPIGYHGNVKTNSIFFFIFEKINDRILYFHFETYKDKINEEKICDFIESRFENKIKLRDESKDWIVNSYCHMKKCKDDLIREDVTNGFLVNEFDFENVDYTSFYKIKIYVLNEKKRFEVFIPNPSWVNPDKAIQYIQKMKNDYISYSFFKKSVFYKRFSGENREKIKSYLF